MALVNIDHHIFFQSFLETVLQTNVAKFCWIQPFTSLKANGLKRSRQTAEPHSDVVGSGTCGKKSKGENPKSASAAKPSTGPGEHASGDFKGYSLHEVPREAWPQNRLNKGKHGYTLHAANGAVP